jgi:hypothetical protein
MNKHHLIRIRQHFEKNFLADIKDEVLRELVNLSPLINPGARIAIAVGSRGIRNLNLIVREVVGFIREKKAHPFIVPAMGSHGGATASGQEKILAGYAITEKTIGVPVRSSMEVVELPQDDSPIPAYMDKNAYESDGIILINRIKPHTDFTGKYESGLIKMAVIGLGKERQASVVHRFGVYGLTDLIPLIAEKILSTGKIIGGIALVENAYDDTMIVKALKSNEFFNQEPLLLDIARENMPALPVDNVDVLIIDQMGKEISGVGIDPNIIGRIKISGQKEPDKPNIKAIIVSDLTELSYGNALGIGLADIITKKLYDKIDFYATYSNACTSSFLERAKIPVVAVSDKEAFTLALRSCGYLKEGEEKIMRIKDTMHLDELYISQSVMDLIHDLEGIELLENNVNLFNRNNEFTPFKISRQH